MPTWGLVVEMTVGMGERKHAEAYVLAHVEGTRDEALAELEDRVRRHAPEHPRNPKRRRMFRTGDGFLLVVDGAWQSFSTRFTVAELLADSAAPAPEPVAEPAPVPASEPVDAVPPPATPQPETDPVARYDDGVPVKPSWLGRADLS
ncbi:hypothetical protein OKJ48_10415 [Streptomyces kunmingensis]|uniref:Uncharacterized protein n=1 Tax=Streptomyces kunmingensis TaxID=68225 RepID=A0ABU6C8Y6_9ACTN|nr:hypothetical protein [Streptomyces kunmingensis]MEB3960651.1 hypothetical protein [Streptomyces kunmingensis]